MEASVVTAALEGAFPLLPLPAMSPRQAHLADQSMSRRISNEDWITAGAPDAGRNWREFTDNELMESSCALAHFDEESFVYYLPAYLSFALRHSEVDELHPASELKGSAVFSVTHRSPYAISRFKKLSPAQRQAVVSFLEFMTEHADAFNATYAKKALERYWKNADADKPRIIVP